MRKKELLEQNVSLYDQLQREKLENARLEKELSAALSQAEELRRTADELKARAAATQPMKKLENRVIVNASVNADVEYGASVIGMLVVEATKLSNRLSTVGTADAKELINLLLGRTEVAKAEILKAVSSDADNEEKHRLVEESRRTALEYFDSVMAQQ